MSCKNAIYTRVEFMAIVGWGPVVGLVQRNEKSLRSISQVETLEAAEVSAANPNRISRHSGTVDITTLGLKRDFLLKLAGSAIENLDEGVVVTRLTREYYLSIRNRGAADGIARG